jgi:iron complex outermembrane recepter protein
MPRSALTCLVMKLSIAAFLCSLSLSVQAIADSAVKRPINIPAQNLASALEQLSRQSGTDLVYRPEQVGQFHSGPLVGEYTAAEAVTELLIGTPLKVSEDSTGALLIATPLAAVANGGEATASQEGGKSSSQDFRVAQVDKASIGSQIDQQNPPQSEQRVDLQEVVVTAQKREERLNDVPVPVAVLDARQLSDTGQNGIRDYFNEVPGLNAKTDGHGYTNLSIRGISTGGYTNPTVAITVDDVPIGATRGFGSRTSAPDLDPSDLARIEVLRGPQGTLYGASSLGGLLKYVTLDPTSEEFHGNLRASGGGVSYGHDADYGLRVSANIPLSDGLALRASAFGRHDAGYVDNPATGKNSVNAGNAYGGRLAIEWPLGADWKNKLAATVQRYQTDGTSDVVLTPGGGLFEQSQPTNLGAFRHTLQIYSDTITGAIGPVDLTSITGYSIDHYDSTIDISIFYGGTPTEALYGVEGAAQTARSMTRSFTQEVRGTVDLTSQLKLLAGGFYEHQDVPISEDYNAFNGATHFVGPLFYDSYPSKYAEYAGFADLTWTFTDQLDVQLGGRWSHNSQSYEESVTGPGAPLVGYPVPAIQPREHSSDNSFTYLVTPRFRFSPDLMLYARIASGYRPGGPNSLCTLFPVDCTFGPDRTKNYEVGLKGNLLDHSFSFDASLYHISWQDIQLQIADPVTQNTFYTNGSRAVSQGIEIASSVRPMRGLTLSGWLALNRAVLTRDIPQNNFSAGSDGDRLPYAAKFSGNAAVDYGFPIVLNFDGFLGARYEYLGDRKDNFAAPGGSRADLPAYSQVDLKGGIRSADWTITLYANNVADRRGVVSIPAQFYLYPALNYTKPRSVGLSVAWSF